MRAQPGSPCGRPHVVCPVHQPGTRRRFTHNGTPTTGAGAAIVDANGNPIAGFFEPTTSVPVTGKSEAGFTTAQNQIFHNQFPDYLVGINIQIPIRNRSAQATNQRTILQLRQIEAQMQQLKNLAVVDVRNTFIALQQAVSRSKPLVNSGSSSNRH